MVKDQQVEEENVKDCAQKSESPGDSFSQQLSSTTKIQAYQPVVLLFDKINI